MQPLITTTAFAIVLGVFHKHEGRSWRRAASIAKTWYLMRAWAWTPWELKSMTGVTTAQAYAAWARKNHAEVLTDGLPEGAKLHWVGPRKEDRIILYFHGPYTILFLQLQLHCSERGGRWAVQTEDLFFQLGRTALRCLRTFKRNARTPSESPSSTTVRSSDEHGVDDPPTDRSPIALIPEYPFPTQLRQAIAAVQHLLDKGISPSNIIIVGDSAGGNLALQLASLLLHPHPSLPLPPRPDLQGADASPPSFESQQPFRGLLLISPGVRFSTDAPSYVRNSAWDLIPFLRTSCSLIPFNWASRLRCATTLSHAWRLGVGGRGSDAYSRGCSLLRENTRCPLTISKLVLRRSRRKCGTRRCLSCLEVCMRIS